MTPRARSKLTVLALFALLAVALVIVYSYRDERGRLGPLPELRCEAIGKTLLQLDSRTVPVTREQACRALQSLAATPAREEMEESRPMREAGSLLVAAGQEVWQVALMAPGNETDIEVCSLRRRRGAGWSVIGEYPAAPVLAELGLGRDGRAVPAVKSHR